MRYLYTKDLVVIGRNWDIIPGLVDLHQGLPPAISTPP